MAGHINIIVATDRENAIGRKGELLCHLSEDLKFFKRTTSGYPIVMGRKTFESLPNGALPNRKNIVLTSSPSTDFAGSIVCRSVEEVLDIIKNEEKVFIIGGGQVYTQFMDLADTLYHTLIYHTFEDADTFFPEIDKKVWQCIEEDKHFADPKNPYDYTFRKLIKRR